MAFRSRSVLWAALSAGAALCIAASWAGAAVVRVDRIRHSSDNGRTRVVVDLSRPSPYTVTRLQDSTGVLLTFEGAALSLSVSDVSVDAHGVRTVRPGVRGDAVEIVFELERGASYDVFDVPASTTKPDRVVFEAREAEGSERAAADTPAPVAVAPPAAPAPRPDSSPASKTRAYVVAVDAGHGGHDAGATGRYGLVEKKLCLDLARRTAEILNRSGRVKAVLTRDSDEYLTLPRRNEIAEQKGADVFVSIHLNTAPSRSARGAEIYFVAPAGAARAADQALASGEAVHDFGLEQSNNDDIVHMLLDVNQQAVLARSELLAESILESVRERDLLPTRAVKQKSFSVLRTISMPSVLVEAGFISNNADAKLVKDPDGREIVARAIADGVLEFFRVHPPQRIDTAERSKPSVVHRVQRGDTLWTLSKRYGTTVARIRELNGLHPSQELRVGQELRLPGAN